MSQWLSLQDYSTKYGVSLSTLRRRIKGDAIAYKIEGGKYFLQDKVDKTGDRQSAIHAQRSAISTATLETNRLQHQAAIIREPQHVQPMASSSFVEASVLSSANRLVEELKAAYAKILQEKEEQISQLKEEVVDLRMLARILESQAESRRSEIKSDDRTPVASATRANLSDDFLFGDIAIKEV
jgi:hypothetical protein